MIPFRTLIAAAALGAALTLGFGWLSLRATGLLAGYPITAERAIDDRPRASLAAAAAPSSFRDAARVAMAAVVHISTRQEQALTLFDYYFGRSAPVREGSGSGVIYSADGYIVTNDHVIRGAQQVEVSLSDGRRFAARSVGTYPEADVAVLKIEAAGLPTIRIGDSDYAEVGDWVLAVGNPYNLNSTVTAGIISARGRDIGIINERNAIESFIQTDAAINPGNSGGALVDVEGALVGINTAIYSRSGGYSGYGFAIPSNLAIRIVDDIIATGSYRQTVLGIAASQLDEAYARELDVPVTRGVVLEEVIPDGAAALAGLRAGDVIVEVQGRPVGTISQFREAISSRRAGEEVELTVLRERRRRRLVLRL